MDPIGKHFIDLTDKWMIISSGAFVLSEVYTIETAINSDIIDIVESIFQSITIEEINIFDTIKITDSLIQSITIEG